jgi:hypothetical protein
MKVVVTNVVNKGFVDVRRCIGAKFGPDIRGMKMIVEASIIVGGNDGPRGCWSL